MRPIRWSDRDRYWGPFTYAKDDRHYRPFALELNSGDGDDYPRCRLRMSAFGHTLILALPPIIKPYRVWNEIRTEPTRTQMIAQGRKPGYWDTHDNEYGFSIVEGALHLRYGPQTHDSETTLSKCFFFPWKELRHVRHSLYDLNGEFFADLPEWGFRNKNGWEVKKVVELACPAAVFLFDDFDGERIAAICKIEERQWKRGVRWFKWMSWFWPDKVRRSLDIQFCSEVGKRKGSWKGGTVGHSIDMEPGELHKEAFQRYCNKYGLTFVDDLAKENDDAPEKRLQQEDD